MHFLDAWTATSEVPCGSMFVERRQTSLKNLYQENLELIIGSYFYLLQLIIIDRALPVMQGTAFVLRVDASQFLAPTLLRGAIPRRGSPLHHPSKAAFL